MTLIPLIEYGLSGKKSISDNPLPLRNSSRFFLLILIRKNILYARYRYLAYFRRIGTESISIIYQNIHFYICLSILGARLKSDNIYTLALTLTLKLSSLFKTNILFILSVCAC